MQKGQIFIWIIVGGLVVAVTGGILFYTNYSNLSRVESKDNRNKMPTPVITSQTPQPNPSDETANWKKYTHSKFSFKHPTNWYAEENPEYPRGNNISFFLVGTKADFGYGDHIGNEIFGFEFSNDERTLEELKREYFPKAVNITIGGKPALKTFIGNPAFDVKSSENESLSIAVWDAEKTSPYLDQILSTFRFTQ